MFDLYPALNYPLIVTQDDSLGVIRIPYLVFNSLECAVWLGCAVYLAARTWRHRRQPRLPATRFSRSDEVWYALAFLLFGLSDLVETSGTTPLLLLWKGACILAIIGYRREMREHYGNRFL